MSNSVRPHRWQPTRLPHPWDSLGKNTGAGCHFLLQCIKVKSESEVVQSCPTLSDPMDCSPPGSPVHGIFQARVLEWGATAFSNCKHRAVMESTTSRLSSHTLLSRRPQTSQPMSSVCHVQKGVSTWSSPPRPTRKSMYRCEGWTIKGG